MRPVVLLNDDVEPEDALAWAQYGAVQALAMLGVSFEAATAGELADRESIALLITPGRDMRTRVKGAEVHQPVPLGPTSGFMEVGGEMATGDREGRTLPRLGPPIAPGQRKPAFEWGRQGDSLVCSFTGHLFATIGVYLSRFSWSGNPVTEGSFVRQIDALWDDVLAGRWGSRPVLDEYLALIQQALIRLCGDLRVPYVRKWPHPVRRGAVCTHGLLLTHDVDAVYATAAFRSAGQGARPLPQGDDPLRPAHQTGNEWFNFRRWVDLETRLGVKSAFFFLSGHPDLSYWCTPGYNVADPVVTNAARHLARLGWEVSVHQLGCDRRELLDGERRHFESAVRTRPTGTRSHYLKHLPHTLSLKAAAGMSYDSTWYAETTESSFLCGTTLPFAPFGIAGRGEVPPLWEFAFVVEDGIVFRAYGDAGRTVDEAVEDGKRALAEVLRYNGYACLNAHQRTFANMSKYPQMPDDWTPAYERLIRYMQDSCPCLWSPLPRELARWWTARRQVVAEPLAEGVAVTNQGRAPIGDLVICSGAADRIRPGPAWRSISDNCGRPWLARPVGPLRPGETRLLSW